MPHLSLLYGDLSMDAREVIRQDADPRVRSKELMLGNVEVWCTEGVVSDWKHIDTFPLQESQSSTKHDN